jgi:hypothetical protein
MSKNQPITARVNKGLFNGKNKVTEPLLSVGPAGVSGNNQTVKDPSPAKKMSSPFKQMANPAAGKGDSNESKTYREGGKVITINQSAAAGKVIKGKETIVKGQKYVGVENDWWKSLTPQQKEAHNKKKRAEIAKDPKYQDKIVKEPDTVEPGTAQAITSEADLYTKDKGDAQTALDRRGNIRNIKNLTSQEKRNDMRTLRGGGFEKDGEVIKRGTQAFKDKKAEIKQNKRDTRSSVIKSEIENSKNQSAGNIKASLSGGYSSKDVLSKERKVTKGDQTIESQISDAKDKAAADVLKAKNTISDAGTAATKFPKPEVNADPTDVPAIEKPESVAKKMTAFFIKKSPLKMKYFK